MNEEYSTVDDFVSGYLNDLEDSAEGVKLAVTDCLQGLNYPAPEDFFGQIDQAVKRLRSISELASKLNDIRNLRRQIWVSIHSIKPADYEDENLDKFEKCIDDVFKIAERQANQALEKTEYFFDEIRCCPFGEQENRSKNAKKFETSVINFFDWLFLNELVRMDLSEIEDHTMKRDGGFEVTPEFDTLSRCGVSFNHIFIECKNYKKPSWRDLVQTYSYTLYCQESEIFRMPLSLLISRQNPDMGSSAWKMRSLVFKRKIDQEQRLILFFDVDDLKSMLDCCKNRADPSTIFKEKFDELWKYDIKPTSN